MYTMWRFVLMTLDPVHIGTGGYRLGRVELSIVREPGTNLPKIPGTSLSGAARSYAAMRYGKPQCAGQGGGEEPTKKHCGRPTCPICYTFGHIRGADGGSAGTVSLSDARLLLFPVYSMAGPIWVTTSSILKQVGFAVTAPELARGQFATTLAGWAKPLNLGWLLLEHKAGAVSVNLKGKTIQSWDDVAGRLVLVDDSLFSQIVNSNLEVRTSVSIEPLTGAAKEGALFTYEALPRATWLWCDVVEDDYQRDPVTKRSRFPSTTNKARAERTHDEEGKELVVYYDNQGEPLGSTWNRPLDVVKAGLELAQYLGIGGMGTRGFGRVRLMGDWEVDHA
ncbi:MAG TPA: RAMP superfamily CRISPR-associated protein [Thermoflexus sp.]|nr:RAMP superfamily CRISPR-associated protein [Thermoflexus sp.]